MEGNESREIEVERDTDRDQIESKDDVRSIAISCKCLNVRATVRRVDSKQDQEVQGRWTVEIERDGCKVVSEDVHD